MYKKYMGQVVELLHDGCGSLQECNGGQYTRGVRQHVPTTKSSLERFPPAVRNKRPDREHPKIWRLPYRTVNEDSPSPCFSLLLFLGENPRQSRTLLVLLLYV